MPSRAPGLRLFLASQSPRRRELLDAIGLPYVVVESDGVEEACLPDPCALAEENALVKARGARLPEDSVGGEFVLGVDTIVVAGERILGKPRDEGEAGDMLRSLSGRAHRVISGVALGRVRLGAARGKAQLGAAPAHVADFRTASSVTQVHFLTLEPAGIEAYLASGEWEGKAGAYAIQGRAALFVEKISGEYSNVVGLPLALLARLFREHGFDLLRRDWV